VAGEGIVSPRPSAIPLVGLPEDQAGDIADTDVPHRQAGGEDSFALSEAVARGELRPLRDPEDRREDEEWEMGVA
jgi:hypothetical protein